MRGHLNAMASAECSQASHSEGRPPNKSAANRRVDLSQNSLSRSLYLDKRRRARDPPPLHANAHPQVTGFWRFPREVSSVGLWQQQQQQLSTRDTLLSLCLSLPSRRHRQRPGLYLARVRAPAVRRVSDAPPQGFPPECSAVLVS